MILWPPRPPPMGQRVALVARAVAVTLYVSLRKTYHVAWLLTNDRGGRKRFKPSGLRRETAPCGSQLAKQENPRPFGRSAASGISASWPPTSVSSPRGVTPVTRHSRARPSGCLNR